MDTNLLKKVLPKGILLGLCIALLLILFRMVLNEGNFLEQLTSVYGILTLICFPVAFVAWFYQKEKKDNEKK